MCRRLLVSATWQAWNATNADWKTQEMKILLSHLAAPKAEVLLYCAYCMYFEETRKGWTWLSEMRSKGMSRQAGNGGISNLAKFLWRNWSPCSELDPPLNYDDMIEVLLCRETIRARSVFFCMPLELKAWYTCWCR